MTSVNHVNKLPPANALPQSAGKSQPDSQSSKVLVVIPRNCTGCRTCEVACTFAHSTGGHLARSRIKVHPVGPDRFVQITCLQCANAACAKVCPTQALVRNPHTSAIEVCAERCVGCGLCEAACPFGHMYFDRETKVAVKCDLCKGRPACATFCPHRALEWK